MLPGVWVTRCMGSTNICKTRPIFWSGLDVWEVAMADPNDHVGLSSSLTDLMTSLAVIFILLLVASHNNKQQQLNLRQDQLDDTRARFEAAQRALLQAQEQTHT